jgi:hypothetical protein
MRKKSGQTTKKNNGQTMHTQTPDATRGLMGDAGDRDIDRPVQRLHAKNENAMTVSRIPDSGHRQRDDSASDVGPNRL